MKKFTKITLIIAAVMAGIGVFCLFGSFALGMSWGTVGNMIDSGKFTIKVPDSGCADVQARLRRCTDIGWANLYEQAGRQAGL